MTTLQAIVLGVVQGISEFLPISSSGHLILVPQLLGWDVQDIAFDVVVNLGTLLAVILYFREKLWAIVRSLFVRVDDSGNRKLFFLLCVSVIPAGLVGFFFGDAITYWFRSSVVVACNLIFWGIVLFIADWYGRNTVKHPKQVSELGVKNSFLIGVAQAVALIPGTSRSGITMSAGLFQKYSKTAVAEFSFLMSIPVSILAGVSTPVKFIETGTHSLSVGAMVWGTVASFVSGIFAIWVVFAVIKKMSFTPFVVYRIAIGIIILFLVR